MIYRMIKIMVTRGSYDKADLLNKLDVFLLNNRLTETEYTELVALIG